jgi:hypothetical protein
MLAKNEIESDCIIVTLKENCSIVIEKVENQTLSILKYHIGDFESMGSNNQAKLQSIVRQSKTNSVTRSKPDENSSQIKLHNDYIDFIRFCFNAFYDKTSREIKSDIFEVC